MTVNISSAAQFRSLLSSSTIVVTDSPTRCLHPGSGASTSLQKTVYADWCGPCKAIAPTYESLSTKHSKPNRVTFTKVNVDNQQEIARQYGVTAMPTFMIFRSGSAIETIRGADTRKLTSAIENAVKLAGPAKPAYSSVGRTLGGGPSSRSSMTRPWNLKGFADAVIAFFGLYLISLFSFDAYSAAENSPFNIHRVPPPPQPAAKAAGRTGAATQVGKKLGTIADLNGGN